MQDLNTKIEALRAWFTDQAAGNNGAMWALTAGTNLFQTQHNGELDTEESFEMLERGIREQAANGVNLFKIRFKGNSPKNGRGGTYTIDFRSPQQQQGIAGAASPATGFFGTQEYGIYSNLQAQIAETQRLLELQRLEHKHEKELDDLRGQIHELRNKEGGIGGIFNKINELDSDKLPVIERLIGRFVAGFNSRRMPAMINESPAAEHETVPRPQRQAAPVQGQLQLAPENTTSLDLLMQGIAAMKKAQIQDAGNKIYLVMLYAAQEPDMFEMLFDNYVSPKFFAENENEDV